LRRIRDQDILRTLVDGTTNEVGAVFFDRLVEHVARALGTRYAWVTEWLEGEGKLRALSFWAGNRHVTDCIYDIRNTPCEPVIDRCELVHIPDRVIDLFPDDPDLEPLGAVSYMGIPLLDTDNRVLGHLAVLHNHPLAEDPRVKAIFSIFAGRAAAELRRVRRDRDLRERELKLSLVIGSAMDAIVELDASLSITRINTAAERIFRCEYAMAVGKSFEFFLTRESCGRLTYYTSELERRADGKQSVWISEGFVAKDVNGESFPAEATLSRFEIDGVAFYTIILRNVNDLLRAEEEIRSLRDETAYLRAQLDELHGSQDIVGESGALMQVLSDVERVARADTTVLLLGETGTGKELIARAIHRRSVRAEHPLVNVNCAAIAPQLQESELFGHEKGAFTGATQRREGRFKLADRGTIFLDEVGEMPVELQAKLLRVLQEGEFEPVGSSKSQKVDVRVVTATNRDLDQMVEEGSFRKDLLYRLNVFPIQMPPLRERGDDIALLAEAFLRKLIQKSGRSSIRLTEDCKARLKHYDWPGNVRELENVIERAFITSRDGRRLNLERALPDTAALTCASSTDSDGARDDRILTTTEIRDLERRNMIRALEGANWKISGTGGAAERLGLKANTLSSRMKSLGIERPR